VKSTTGSRLKQTAGFFPRTYTQHKISWKLLHVE